MTPKDHDRMLEVLRSLSPPRDAPREAPPVPEGPGRGGDAPGPREATAPPSSPAARDGRIIQLRVEEIGLFFLAAVVLVVMAFLMGWYGRGTGGAPRRLDNALDLTGPRRLDNVVDPTGPRRLDNVVDPTGPRRLDDAGGPGLTDVRSIRRLAVDARRAGPTGAPREPAPATSPSPEEDLGTRPGRVTTPPARSGATFSILVAKFPLGGAGDAEDHSLSLRQRGYPAWMRRTPEGIELCVGRFDSPTDVLARQWLPKLRKLSTAYSSPFIVRIP